MFLLVALSEVLLLWGWMCRSEGLCSPTRFYKNCWIRQFPGLSLDLEHSQEQGARILKVYVASTAGQCSQACCILKDVFCNLAVFYYKTHIHNINCIHMYCPVLESCIVKPTRNVVLYNITPGVDPDLLVFEKLSFKDTNTWSSFHKWERHGGARVAGLDQDELSSTRFLFPEASSPTTAPKPGVDRSNRSSAVDVALNNSAITLMASASAMDDSVEAAELLPGRNSSTPTSGNAKASSAPIQMASLSPGQVLPNNSKPLNETKVYSGRNNSSDDDEGQQPSEEMAGGEAWWPLIVLCSMAFTGGCCCCCCGIFWATGWKKRRRYKPRQKGRPAPSQFIKYSDVKSSF